MLKIFFQNLLKLFQNILKLFYWKVIKNFQIFLQIFLKIFLEFFKISLNILKIHSKLLRKFYWTFSNIIFANFFKIKKFSIAPMPPTVESLATVLISINKMNLECYYEILSLQFYAWLLLLYSVYTLYC